MGRSDDRPRLPTGTVTFLLTDIEGSTPTWVGLAIRLEPVGRLVWQLRHLFRSGVAVSYCGRPVGGTPGSLPPSGGPRLHQFERCVRAGVREQPRALADDHGADEQGDLVDKLVGE